MNPIVTGIKFPSVPGTLLRSKIPIRLLGEDALV
jgi:hypothetical protein